MPRSVNTVASRQRRKKVLKQTKGYFGRRKNVWTVAKNAYEKGLSYAYADRRKKKANFRALWIQRINAEVRKYDMSYRITSYNVCYTKLLRSYVSWSQLYDVKGVGSCNARRSN